MRTGPSGVKGTQVRAAAKAGGVSKGRLSIVDGDKQKSSHACGQHRNRACLEEGSRTSTAKSKRQRTSGKPLVHNETRWENYTAVGAAHQGELRGRGGEKRGDSGKGSRGTC